jgi:hypothetical protein
MCSKHDVFIRSKIPRKCLLIEAANGEVIGDHEAGHVDINTSSIIRSKIYTHFIKGKIFVETILVIPRELGSLENLVNLAKK